MVHLEGKRFGKLTVIERRPNYKWLCQCDCGTCCEVLTWNLTSGRTNSCGCHKGSKPIFSVSQTLDKDCESITFLEVAIIYANSRSDWDVSTRKTFDDQCDYFRCLDGVDINNMTHDVMTMIMGYFAQDKYAAGTYKNMKTFFNGVFKFAMKNEIISSNPMDGIRKIKKKTAKNNTIWTVEQFDTFINTFGDTPKDDKLILLYSIGMFAGLRKCETVALLLSDIDLSKKTITVHQNYKFSAGCIGDCKTANSNRTIGMCDRLYECVLQYLKSNPEIIEENNLLFGKIPSASTIRYHMEKHQKGLDIPHISYHRFRHSHVVLLLVSSDSLNLGYLMAVAEHMGDRLETIIKVYMHSSYTENQVTEYINKSVKVPQ